MVTAENAEAGPQGSRIALIRREDALHTSFSESDERISAEALEPTSTKSARISLVRLLDSVPRTSLLHCSAR